MRRLAAALAVAAAAAALLAPGAVADAPVLNLPGDISGVEATGPGGASVSFADATATDADDVSGTPSVGCDHSSGDTFPIGTTTVSCTATSSGTDPTTPGAQTTGSFSVTVVDTTPPSFSGGSGSVTAEATSAAGAVVSYDSPSANDIVDGSTPVNCSPSSGSTFPLGASTVNCSTSDTRGNVATTSIGINVVDTTVPNVVQPSDVSAFATSAAGAVVNYPGPQAGDAVGTIHTDCNPTSGSVFPIGRTTVSCLVSDGRNDVTVTFTVTVAVAKTTLTGVPADMTVEATGPAGAVVAYPSPTASDAVNGQRQIGCSPASRSTFPIGDTTVTCAAGGTSASFDVTVRDTKAPTLAGVPADQRALVNGVARASVEYASPTAIDAVDGAVKVTCAPASGASFPLGSTKVTCRAQDSHGNAATASFAVQVLDRVAPPPVPRVEAHLDGKDALVSWKRWPGTDGVAVQVVRRPGHGQAGSAVVYSGSATSFVDTDVKPGVKYRYDVAVVDRAGNRSRSATTFALLPIGPLKTPFDGEQVSEPPLFSWRAAPHASYYNVQLWLIRKKGQPVKVFTDWPKANRLQLPETWKYSGKRRKLAKGTYRWYVWPGIGPLSAARYGKLLGAGTFVVG